MEDLKRLVAVFGMGVLAFAFLAQGTGDRGVGGGGYDANDSAMFIVSGMPLIFYFMTRARRVWARILFGLGLLTCSSAVVLSGSRGGFIALVVTLVYSLFFLKGVNKVTRLVVVAAAIVIVVTQADGEYWDRMQSITAEDDYNRTSYTGRVEVWKRGIGYMVQNPIAGVGIDNFSVAEGWNPQTLALLQQGIGVKFSVAHSIWIQVAAEMGIPGVLALAAMFVQAIRGLWTAGGPTVGRKRLRGNQALDELNDLGRPLIGVLLAVAVAGSFLSRAYSSILWLPLALSLALIKVDVFTRRDQAEHSAAGRPVRRRPVITTPFGAPLPARSRGGYLPASRRPHVT